MLRLRVPVLAACLIFVSQGFAAESIIKIESDPGEFIFQGATTIILDADNPITAGYDFDDSVFVSVQDIGMTFRIEAPGGDELQIDNYEEATRWPFQSLLRPGMEIFANSRGCNNLEGRFVVRDYLIDDSGLLPLVQRLAFDMIHRCDFADEELFAQVRFNTDVPLDVPEPTAAAGRDRIVLEREVLTLDASNTMPGDGEIVSWMWTQVSGPLTTIENADTATPTIEAPDVSGLAETVTLELRVDNATGKSDTDRIRLEVRNRSAPQTFMRMQSSFDDLIGQGRDHFINDDDGLIAGLISDDGNQLNLDLDQSTWSFKFAAPEPEALVPGVYTGLAQVPFHADSPGINVSAKSRSCADVAGTFTVFEISPGFGGTIGTFGADFEQICNNTGLLTGQVRFNVVIPEADAGADISIAERSSGQLDASASVDAAGTIVDYAWVQTKGPAASVDLSDPVRPLIELELGDGVLEEMLTFELTVTDEVGYTESDVVDVTVTQNNAPPAANDDTLSLGQGGIAEVAVLANDTDADGTIDPDSIVLIATGENGTARVTASGTISLRVDSTFAGTEVLTYTILDNDGSISAPGQVTIEFTPGPVGLTDLAEVDEGGSVTIDVLSNDVPADSPLDRTTIGFSRLPGNGTVSANASGVITYTPDNDFSGADSFEYTVTDSLGRVSPPTYVTVNVKSTAPPAPPAAANPVPTDNGQVVIPPSDAAAPDATDPAVAPVEAEPILGRFGDIDAGSGAPDPLGLLFLLALLRRRFRVKG